MDDPEAAEHKSNQRFARRCCGYPDVHEGPELGSADVRESESGSDYYGIPLVGVVARVASLPQQGEGQRRLARKLFLVWAENH